MRGLRILVCTLMASSLFLACGGASEGEETADDKLLEPLAEPFPVDRIQRDAAVVRLSRNFFNGLNTGWKALVMPIIESMAETSPMLGGAHLDENDDLVIPIEVPCQVIPIADNLDLSAVLCDTNLDGACAEDGSERCSLDVIAQSLELAPSGTAGSSAGALTATVKAALDTHEDGLLLSVATALGNASCGLHYDASTISTVSLGLDLALEPAAPYPLHFELAEVGDGVYLDGLSDLSGAISVKAPSGGSGLICGLASVAIDPILSLFSSRIQSALKTAVDKATAQRCAFATDDPEDADYLNGTCAAADQTCACFSGDATCERADLRCRNADGSFPSIYPGYEGRVVLGKALSAFGADVETAFDFGLVAGGTLDIDGRKEVGLNSGYIQLGALAGVLAFPEENAACVPPTMTAPEPVGGALDMSQGPAGHQVGVAISEYALNNALYQVTRSGALCLDIGTETVAMLTSTLFAGFVPSLSLLGKDMPMSLAIRPGQAPRLTLGKNIDIDDPLATLDIEDLSLDVYASIDERFVRLFTINLDVSAPVALELGTNDEGQTTLKPVLGPISQMLVFNTEVETNSEILTEDISNLGTQLSSLLSMADGLIGGFLNAYALPDLAGLRFRIDGIEGMGGSDEGGYGYLGAFVSVEPAPAVAATE